MSDSHKKAEVVFEGKFIRLLRKDGWEYIQRSNCSGVVIILAITNDNKVLFAEQYRIPVGKNVIEFPAGLANDLAVQEEETLESAALRELLEETGYQSEGMTLVTSGPSGGGASADIVTIFKAEGIKKVSSGGGDESESITVHEVPLEEADGWLAKKGENGCLIDPKVYAGLYFLKKYNV